MKLAFLLEQLEELDFFKEFKQTHPDAFLYAGFFVFDQENPENHQYTLDFFIPSQKKAASIKHPFKEIVFHPDNIETAKPMQLDLQIDIDNITEKVREIMTQNSCNNIPNKIVTVLQDNTWGVTCITPSLELYNMNVCSIDGKCQKFDKSNFSDFIKVQKK
jgi:hypothetical protein